MSMQTLRFPLWQMLLFCALFIAIPSFRVLADNWQADLKDTNLPNHFVAIDKDKQKFFFFEKNSPLRLKYEFPCMTGQRPGDKQITNDLKTPEGIYFVKNKISSGLDFKEFGGIAYPINYPNPVDKLRGKTGHNIWIHSKGFGLVPTKGCVVIGLDEIGRVGPQLTPGTAVILAEGMHIPSTLAPCDQAEELRTMMQEWSNAWQSRSTKMFDFYDQDAYSRATENFAAFRANKERIFKMINSIKLYNRDIHVLEGPGYWVTWAEQCYAATNHSTEGIRRLYWQRGEDQRFRIVGMEWSPQPLGLLNALKNGKLVAETTNRKTDGNRSISLPPIHLPEGQAAPKGKQQKVLQVADISDPLVPVPSMPTPRPPEFNWEASTILDQQKTKKRDAREKTDTTPASVETKESPVGTQPEAASLKDEKNEQDAQAYTVEKKESAHPSDAHQDDKERTQVPSATTPSRETAVVQEIELEKKKPADLPLTQEDANSLKALCADFARLLEQRDQSIENLFAKERFNRVKQVPRNHSLKTELRHFERMRSEAWLEGLHKEATVEKNGDIFKTTHEQFLIGPSGKQEGEYTLWWQKSDNSFAIVGLLFTPKDVGLSSRWFERISLAITADVSAWYKAWEKADIDRYMVFYADNALQQGRRGAKAIRDQKERLWQRIRPTKISFTGLRVMQNGKGMKVDMTQTYSDSTGKTDRGIKILLLTFNGTRWQILEEDWKPLSAM